MSMETILSQTAVGQQGANKSTIKGRCVISNEYKHEHDEARITRDDRDRPNMPKEDAHLRQEMKSYLCMRKLSYALAVLNLWYPSAQIDGYDRIVIPCSNSFGLPYYQARAIDQWAFVRYNSPPATRLDSVVLVWPDETQSRHQACIVEGPADALAAAGCGFLGIGVMGNMPPSTVIAFITGVVKDMNGPVLVLPDADHVELGSYIMGSLAVQGVETRIVFPQEHDLAGMKPLDRWRLLCNGTPMHLI